MVTEEGLKSLTKEDIKSIMLVLSSSDTIFLSYYNQMNEGVDYSFRLNYNGYEDEVYKINGKPVVRVVLMYNGKQKWENNIKREKYDIFHGVYQQVIRDHKINMVLD